MFFDRGRHPATRLPLLTTEGSSAAPQCGDCAFLYERPGNHGPRLKCRLSASRRGPGLNLLPIFPACVRFEAAGDRPSA
jgi:hypothetical protein